MWRYLGMADLMMLAKVTMLASAILIIGLRGDSSVTSKLAVPRGTFPFQIHVYGLIEQIGRWARATGKDSATFTALASANQTSGGYVRKRGGDSLTLMFDQGQLAGLGPFTFRLDRQGRLTWLTGKGSTVQVEVERVASVPIPTTSALTAPEVDEGSAGNSPRPSRH